MNNVYNFNGKIVRHNGSVYKIISCRLGKSELIDAESVYGPDKGTVVNLQKGRTPLAGAIRQALNLNLAS